jgi:hypothetical protein
MKILYGNPIMDPDELLLVRNIIQNNILTTMQTLAEYSEEFGYAELWSQVNRAQHPRLNVTTTNELTRCFLLQAMIDAAKLVCDNDDMGDELDAPLIAALTLMWDDAGIQKAWARRAEFQVIESTKYYFEHLARVTAPSYMRKEENTREDHQQFRIDALHARVRTSGIVAEKYDIDNKPFEIYDVGGQRNERRKWIHVFDRVTAVIFVAAISEYDQKLFEDGTTNRMVEALELFEDILANPVFATASVILFLNKCDLFAEKIAHSPIADSSHFSDYTGGADYEKGCAYFTSRFQQLNHDDERKIYAHVTNATDTSLVRTVMDSCRDVILRKNIADSGIF